MSARVEPPVSDESVTFWDATREKQFLLPWCTECDTAIWYPRLDVSAVSRVRDRVARGVGSRPRCMRAASTGNRVPAGVRTTGRTSSRWSISPKESA